MRLMRQVLFLSMLLPLTLWSVAPGVSRADDNERDAAPGAVFTMDNATDGNQVLMFRRAPDGALTAAGAFATGGFGSGGGLGNQGGLVLSENQRWLFAVNAGSDEVSVFAVRRKGLVLVDKIASGGSRPVSVTEDHGLLYVLNAGSDNIAGFTLNHRGKLSPLPGSVRPLSAGGTAPAQIEFDPSGHVLVVTEKATNVIDTYVVGEDGLASGPNVHISSGATPFGFSFDRHGQLLVSEAAGGAPNASSVSSYAVSDDGVIEVISASVPTTETAACWVIVTKNGRFAYTTNTGSGSISAYRVAKDGSLSLRDADGRTGETGAGSAPIDMALSANSRFLFALNAGNGAISAFRVDKDGALNALPGVSGLPGGSNGLAAF